MDFLFNPELLAAFFTLTILEIVLGIDNLVFISILSGKLPEHQQKKARNIGLFLAMFVRIALLFSLSWIMQLSEPLFTMFKNEISGRDIILAVGGLFLIFKSTMEIHNHLEGEKETEKKVVVGFANVLSQIVLLDIIFSLDSVITAIGLVDQINIMIAAVVIAIIFMIVFVNSISKFIDEHPTIKILALSFLLLIGMALIGDAFDMHIPKGYIYFAMAFSTFVEMINLKIYKKKH
tara:strand:+ start:94 stop:798 length:705 start_codon:yes stop_codon:yes gene_type:complete